MRSESAELYHCVALNRELEARGDSKPFALASPFPAAVMGLTGVEHPSFQFYYFDGIPVRRYVNDKLLKPKKLSPKHAVPLSTTQEESWWRLPDGLDEKEQRYVPGFPFGTDDMAPWQWDEQRKRPENDREKERITRSWQRKHKQKKDMKRKDNILLATFAKRMLEKQTFSMDEYRKAGQAGVRGDGKEPRNSLSGQQRGVRQETG